MHEDILQHPIFIPKRFHDTVIKHIILNCCNPPEALRPSLILAIQGPPGTGKSFQTRHVLDQYNIKFETLDSAALSGHREQDSITILKETYLKLGIYPQASAIIIEDFDTSIATEQEGYYKTTNSCILNAFLMHLCDDPTTVQGKYNRQIPIIMTGNNFKTLYAPLLRPGRSKLYEWIPKYDELIAMINQIFHESRLSPYEIESILTHFPGKQIAFFQQIKATFFDSLIDKILESFIDTDFSRKSLEERAKKLLLHKTHAIQLNDIYRIGDTIKQDAKDYLC